ncbi:BTB/POZ domain-containing protein At1g50280 [Cajanus cajan]|uniref:BTB/POZ domain-containing protein At1g30440 family n=1 Tax=Cajanus cajan TaxID=3821 RepID=A0A151TMU0_CAJCA|nr:BTB/POZ domain-containing protein At1g50280 [Cajanus cajan]KYP68363.1 BTB/POZ domain-containing protein At1g30440 family [Cajanus cajan]
MPKPCDLQINIDGQQIFFLKEKVISKYCGGLKKVLNHQKRRCQVKQLGIRINDFPGGPEGFELVSRFCYNNGKIQITVANVSLLHCCAVYLGMTEEVFSNNLLQQTETFLEGIYYWKWSDIQASLKSCQLFYAYVDGYGLLEKIICALAKIVQNSDANFVTSSPSCSSSSTSPESNSAKRFSFASKATPEKIKSTLSRKAWWFDDLETLPPKIIEKLFQTIGAYKADNKDLVLTRFLLHYLKIATQTGVVNCSNSNEYAALAETAAYGVIFVGRMNFSCRGLFWVLRIVSKFGLSRGCRTELEKLIGGMLEQATLDDLLVSGHDIGVYYDVNLVIRLVRLFVDINGSDGVSLEKLKKVGRLVDKYLREISPDQNLKISKFLGVAECLPDSARDCYDGVYKAIDIYIESHPIITFEERSRLCRCLNYSKLSFEASKDLAKNPRIPPRVAMQALISQQSKIPTSDFVTESPRMKPSQIVLYNETNKDSFSQEKKDMRLNLERMQWGVIELEKLHKMNGQVSKLLTHHVSLNPARASSSPRFC